MERRNEYHFADTGNMVAGAERPARRAGGVIDPVLRSDELALLLYIHTHTQREGYAPATRDMRAALGMTQRALYRRLDYLEAWGYITRERRRVRGVRVVRLPNVDSEAA